MFGFLMISNSIFQTSSYVNKIWPIIDPFCPTAVDHLHSIGLDPSTLCLCVAMLKTAQLQLTHKVGPCNLSRPDAIKLVDKCHTMVNTKMATVQWVDNCWTFCAVSGCPVMVLCFVVLQLILHWGFLTKEFWQPKKKYRWMVDYSLK